MKLDVANLRFFTRDDFRVLTAIEMGMRNHDLVPTELIAAIAGLKGGGAHKVLANLLRNKLIAHERQIYDGYRLTYPGYDYLALKTLLQRGVIAGVGRQIGVGKESDIFLVVNDEGEQLALKLQRLGRTSFRAIKRKRDYLKHRRNASWLYMSRLGALKEYAFMKALHDAGFPTPIPIECNRHAVLMSLVPGVQLAHTRTLPDVAATYTECMNLVARLADCGLIHCDLNEFNLMVAPGGASVVMIDFPQMVSLSHENGQELFERDVNCLRTFFEKRFGYTEGSYPTWRSVMSRVSKEMALDVTVEASGFISGDEMRELQQLLDEQSSGAAGAAEGEEEEEDDEDGGKDGDGGDALAAGQQETSAAGTAPSGSGSSSGAGPTPGGPLFVTLAQEVLLAAGADDAELDAAVAVSLARELAQEGEAGAPGAATDPALSSSAVSGSRRPAGAVAPVDSETDTPATAGEGEEEGDGPSGSDDDEEEDGDDSSDEGEVEAELRKRMHAAAQIDDTAFDRPPEGTRTRPGGGRVRVGRRGEAYLEREGASTSTAAGGKPVRPKADGDAASEAPVTDEVKARVKRGLEKKHRRAELDSMSGTRSRNNAKDKDKARARDALKNGDIW